MSKPRATNARSLHVTGEVLEMEIERGYRWRCGCGVVGPLVILPVSQHTSGRQAPERPPPGLLLNLTRHWQEHVEEEHPDADLTFEEWEDG